jgi:site-specific DNA recombinase
VSRRSTVGTKKSSRKLRCAIYTRKSTEEGLEQNFNSLDAQREACEAFISSQKHEGWVALPTQYDDGGYSGGTLERPALQRLLADIRVSKVDIVVVYKIDRLTRSLLDFAKIVEVFDAHGVSFVSVTQAFNTATSMGRLTLNVLLSFAQFEREVTGERIRDKIAASKKKGMWMGGYPPLGYDVKDRKLAVNEAEADTVPLYLPPLQGTRFGTPAQGASRCGRRCQQAPHGARWTAVRRQAANAGSALPHAAEPPLSRRDRA